MSCSAFWRSPPSGGKCSQPCGTAAELRLLRTGCLADRAPAKYHESSRSSLTAEEDTMSHTNNLPVPEELAASLRHVVNDREAETLYDSEGAPVAVLSPMAQAAPQ